MIGKTIAWFEAEGSTRPMALIRIGLAALIWIRFGDELALFTTKSWPAVQFSAAFFLFTTMMFFGIWSRLSTAVCGILVGSIYFVGGLVWETPGWQGHHVYLMFASAMILSLAPCGASLSVDRYLAVSAAERRGVSPPTERGRLMAMRLLALQLVAVYLWAAIDKTTLAWINGDRLQQIFWWHYNGRPLFDLLSSRPVTILISVAVLVVEYLIVPGMLMRRYQPFAVPVGLAMHAGFFILLPVKTFSATMVLLYLAAIDADATNRMLERLLGLAPKREPG